MASGLAVAPDGSGDGAEDTKGCPLPSLGSAAHIQHPLRMAHISFEGLSDTTPMGPSVSFPVSSGWGDAAALLS